MHFFHRQWLTGGTRISGRKRTFKAWKWDNMLWAVGLPGELGYAGTALIKPHEFEIMPIISMLCVSLWGANYYIVSVIYYSSPHESTENCLNLFYIF